MDKQETIMIVDDDQIQLDLLAQSLANENFNVVTALNGEEAINKYEKNGDTYNVIVTDIMMPKISGLELMEKIKRMNSNQQIIVITGHLDLDSTIQAIHLGAFDFIPKPIEIFHLKHSIQMCIKSDRLRRENEAMQKRLMEELSLANEIQESLLPDTNLFTKLSDEMGITLSASSESVSEVNGDLYNVRRINKDLVSISIADCKGHGVSAGMMTMAVITLLNSIPPVYSSARETLVQLDLKLREFVPVSQFINMLHLLYDSKNSRLIIARAGMPYPYLFRQSNHSVEKLIIAGCPLRLSTEQWQFEEKEIILEPGDKLVLYSDGLSEAMDLDGNMFGDPEFNRLQRFIQNYGNLPTRNLHNKLIHEWEKFCKGADATDDYTLLILGKDS